jgi:hypothetical protein
LRCDLLDNSDHNYFEGEIALYRIAWTTFAKRHVCEGGKFGIESKSKRGCEKDDMHVVITIELTTIVSSIPTFQHQLIPMFFHMDSIKKLKNSI